MKTTQRFNNAVKKLYDAFHNNTLNPGSCKQCAVGTILDNKDFWQHFTHQHGSTELTYVGVVHQKIGRTFMGYSPIELLQIEQVFLRACGFSVPITSKSAFPKNFGKDHMFAGLEQVVAFLCQLDNIPNVMDCSVLFDYERSPIQLESESKLQLI